MKTPQDIHHLQHLCRQRGLKLTPQRLEIYRQLASTTEHPSAETVYRRVRKNMPTISLDTVYRTLSSLEKIGAAVRVEASGDKARFDADMTPHNHLICTVCQKIADFSWPGFEALPVPDSVREWGEISAKNAVIRGVCQECREAAQNGLQPGSAEAGRQE